jgi:hypothetical protein
MFSTIAPSKWAKLETYLIEGWNWAITKIKYDGKNHLQFSLKTRGYQ